MFKVVSQSLGRKWQRLTNYSGSQRLSKFALILLFGLDLFVLGMLVNGIRDATSRIEVPSSAISYECEQMTEGFEKLTPTQRLASLQPYFIDRSQYENSNAAEPAYEHSALPVCEQVHAKLLSFASNEVLTGLVIKQKQLNDSISSTQTKINELKESYDSALLEKVAGQKREDSILPAEANKIKTQLAQLNSTLESQQQQAAQLQQALEQHELVVGYNDFLKTLSYPPIFAQERTRLERAEFWYPFKTLAAEVAFLLPMLVLALLWNGKVLRSQNGPQILISSHLTLVCLLPLFVCFFYFFYELLPHRLLSELMDWLDHLNLGFLWHYVVIIGSILACVIVIVIAQKTVFSPARLRTLRLRKVQCRECGEKLQSPHQVCCEFCGTRQIEDCGHCGKPQRTLAYFCSECGSAKDAAITK